MLVIGVLLAGCGPTPEQQRVAQVLQLVGDADAGEPVRTKNPAASKDEELKHSEAAALGTQTFRLLNVYPTPAPHKGHKVEAKGFLIRDPGGNRINVTAVQTLAPRCD